MGLGDRGKDTWTIRDSRVGIQDTASSQAYALHCVLGKGGGLAPGYRKGPREVSPYRPAQVMSWVLPKQTGNARRSPHPPPQGVRRLPLDSNDSSTSPASVGIWALAGLRDLRQGPSIPGTSDSPSVAIGSGADRALPPPDCVTSGQCLFLSEAQVPLL